MKGLKRHIIALHTLAFVLVSMTALGQTPPELGFGINSRPPDSQLVPPAKFMKARHAIPNTYIVVLNDEAVPLSRSLDETRAHVSDIARRFAQAHGGKVGFIYHAALRGFSVELPTEAAAVAISRSPRVKFVEEAALIPLATDQPNPPWGLDRIDQMVGRNGFYTYNATGAGVVAYVIDTGIRASHVEFGGRASIAADFIGNRGEGCFITSTNNDCDGHGTSVASIVGGATLGVAKGVTLRSLKACFRNPFTNQGECDNTAIVASVDRVTTEHLNNPTTPKVVNMSLGGDQSLDPSISVNNAVNNSISQGVTYAVAAGNANDDARFYYPANVEVALTVGASDINDARASFSNFGSFVDLFAPGLGVLAASSASNTATTDFGGTSAASPHVAGAVALYLQGRTGRTACFTTPLFGPANTFGSAVSTCPERVTRFIKSNAALDKLSNVNGVSRFGAFATSPNRLLYTGALPTTINPIENPRFFVWQLYEDILGREPDHDGLNGWANYIAGCGSDHPCLIFRRTDTARSIIDSPEFRGKHPALQNPGTPEYNQEFVRQCYLVFLRRNPDAGGFNAWLNYFNSTGDEHGVVHGFIYSDEYWRRFGQP